MTNFFFFFKKTLELAHFLEVVKPRKVTRFLDKIPPEKIPPKQFFQFQFNG